jgi:hypothetical protein
MAAPTFVINTARSRPSDFPPSSQRKEIVGVLTVDGSVGALPNDIPASTFGLAFIERASPAVKDDNSLIVITEAAFDGKSLLGKAAASAAPANIPAGNYQIEVFGY